MRLLTTNGGVIESTRLGPLAVPGEDDQRTPEAHRPVIVPQKQHIAVLVVIPSDVVPSEIALRLDASGYEVRAASTGRAAVEVAEQTPPDIILLDLDGRYEISLAVKVSGFRLLHLLGRLRQAHPMAVVVMTSQDYTEVEGPVRASADDFINKPIQPAQLHRRLQGALERVRNRHQQHHLPAVSPALVGEMPVKHL
jgi:DNA-binding response OmpR family regulator